MAKKPTHKNQDWQPIQIVAAVRMRGYSLQKISREQHLHVSAVGQAMYRPYPKSERIIADFLGVTPQTIWPSRYHADGTPKSGRGERGRGRYKRLNTSTEKPEQPFNENNTPVHDKLNVNISEENLQAA